MDDWRGYFLAAFAIVWIANIYMALFALIKVDVNLERLQYKNEQEEAKNE